MAAVGLLAMAPPGLLQAQSADQSDQIGELLRGTTGPALKGGSGGNPTFGTAASAAKPISTGFTLRAGQSRVERAGVSALGASQQAGALIFTLESRPACGEAAGTPAGIILTAAEECVGRTLEFTYTVARETSRSAAVRVEAKALVQSGLSSCGMANAPFEFVGIPAGTYALKDAPLQIADLVKLIGKPTVTVGAFCISEEPVPGDEVEAFLALMPVADKRRQLPEAMDAALHSVQVDAGRSLRPPARAISHRMAKSYAAKLSEAVDRRLSLPLTEHYIAAAMYLLKHKAAAPATQSFLVSLRSGLMEWTDTPCDGGVAGFTAFGTTQQRGELEKYCFVAAQKVSRMGFRLLAASTAE